MTIKTLYMKERAAGWPAVQAFRNANIKKEWGEKVWNGFSSKPELGTVRLMTEPDMDIDLSYLDQDEFKDLKKKEYYRADQDGCWGIIGEFWNGEKWEHADSVWGFIGNDWEGSGYDTDVMRTTLDAAKKLAMCPLCGHVK